MADATDKMREALELAEAALMGRNMNMTVVRRKIREALAKQPAQGEAVSFDQWMQTEAHPHLRASGPLATEWLRAIYEAGQRNAPPAPSVPESTARDAARYRHIRDSIGGGRLVEDFAYSDLDAALDAGIAAAAAAQR